MSSASDNPLGLIEGEKYEIQINGTSYDVPFLSFNVETEQFFFNVDGMMAEVLMQNINPVSRSPSFDERISSDIGSGWSSSTSSAHPPPTSFSKSKKKTFKKPNRFAKKPSLKNDDHECVICSEVKHAETGKICNEKCPRCSAIWHKECIDKWFKIKKSCPQCRLENFIPKKINSKSLPSPFRKTEAEIFANKEILPENKRFLTRKEAFNLQLGSIFLVYERTSDDDPITYRKLGTYKNSTHDYRTKFFSNCDDLHGERDSNWEEVNAANYKNDNAFFVLLSKAPADDSMCTIMGGKKDTKRRNFGRKKQKPNKTKKRRNKNKCSQKRRN